MTEPSMTAGGLTPVFEAFFWIHSRAKVVAGKGRALGTRLHVEGHYIKPEELLLLWRLDIRLEFLSATNSADAAAALFGSWIDYGDAPLNFD